ncbi:hypothetical protein N7508_000143 [Penicillium antarcticum]|uniref:uncharacterized protein n=1 Tax=Penicillium antarcticum TaxID=416450 RepID=UPI0023826773|nr:uncharacterized protein N7508_000143 [Penicillium antarcticum]KAJ5319860.1 hypothetical protein N7508_000143 [Penicillium antarcticum]
MPEAIFIRNGWYAGEEDPANHENPWYVDVFFKDRDMRKSDKSLMDILVSELWRGHAAITAECLHHAHSHCISLLIDHDGTDMEKKHLAYLLARKIRDTVYAGRTTISRNKLFRGEGLGIIGLEFEGPQLEYR